MKQAKGETRRNLKVQTKPPRDLTGLLRSTFGFDGFRPYQEAVCDAAAEGRNILCVMPTGAGKSLCYQLPGIVRGGATLVISPLIALIEDQVAKLRGRGLAAERIHTGRDREASRGVCRKFLDGKLDYLFIAPERLAVPGFPEMLEKRCPVLVAIDEAHCISHWGHDFRPDYRMIAERLPFLSAVPVIALTATATPLVQDDIIAQLRLKDAARFVHGFRRDNIAVEAVEMSPSERPGVLESILRGRDRRPAIVYAPTRKMTGELAEELSSRYKAAAYHAGLPGEERDRVQRSFQSSECEVVVATIAFGMGIDKPDIRTVVHMALPASVEQYYQEIGRAGRDGKPSRAVLLHSYADRKLHEFFHEQGYPPVDKLRTIFRTLGKQEQSLETLVAKLNMPQDDLERALDKLWIHGGAVVDPEGNARRGNEKWEEPYVRQREYRLAQIELIQRFADGSGCRMTHLIRHFGDREDRGGPCGLCDNCNPHQCLIRTFRKPNRREESVAMEIVDLLKEYGSRTSGQLHKEVDSKSLIDRRSFEIILDALSQAGLVSLENQEFEKDGKTIPFRRATLTRKGNLVRPENLADISLKGESTRSPDRLKKPRKKRAGKLGSFESKAGIASASRYSSEDQENKVVEGLRLWRLAEARRKGIPAFRILSDRTLTSIAAARPRSEAMLLSVPGVGHYFVKNFGRIILEIIQAADVIVF